MENSETTVGDYHACVDANVCIAPPRLKHCLFWGDGKQDHPMNCVSRPQAAKYCSWIGQRLPSKREWAWVTRGREENRKAPWGSNDVTCQYANLDLGHKANGTHPCNERIGTLIREKRLGWSRRPRRRSRAIGELEPKAGCRQAREEPEGGWGGKCGSQEGKDAGEGEGVVRGGYRSPSRVNKVESGKEACSRAPACDRVSRRGGGVVGAV
ncbi:MAG: SUMF1/EgtB/PvdO family nonheme iron enzyme [Nannocystaceae bacterium]